MCKAGGPRCASGLRAMGISNFGPPDVKWRTAKESNNEPAAIIEKYGVHVGAAALNFAKWATEDEPQTSLDVLAALPDGWELVGFEDRVKSPSSLARKLEVEIGKGRTLTFAKAKINDALRYTMLDTTNSFARGVADSLVALQKCSYDIVQLTNMFVSDARYKGFHATGHAPVTLFEVQYHTPQSYLVKQQTDSLYHRFRELPPGSKEARKLESEMQRLSDSIQNPPNIATIAVGNVRTNSIKVKRNK